MPPIRKTIVLAFLATTLVGCGMPTEPEGIHEQGMTRLADKLREQGDDTGAADLYQRSLQHKPNDAPTLRKLGELLESHGEIETAENYYGNALRIAPHDKGALQDDGRVLIRLGRPADALPVFERLLEDDSDDARARNGKGIALDYLGRHEEAEKEYRRVLEDKPDDLTTLNNLAHSLILTGHYDQAIALLEPHANDKDATPALRQNLAEAYGLSGMYVDAERMARIDLKPQDVKRNLAFYRSRRSALALEPRLAADLGRYATPALANVAKAKASAVSDDSNLTLTVTPEVESIGGTPIFTLRATGFRDAERLKDFCGQLLKNGLECGPKQ